MAGDRERKWCTTLAWLIRHLNGIWQFRHIALRLSSDCLLAVLVPSMIISGYLCIQTHEQKLNSRSDVTEPHPSEVGKTLPDAETERADSDNTMTSTGDPEESDWDHQLAMSERTYRKGQLLLKPEISTDRADAISVYRGGRLILQRARQQDFDFMLLGFAYTGPPTKGSRKFDGGREDFISGSTKQRFNPFVDLNGDGVPDLIIVQTSNGPEKYSAFSLGTRARLLGTIDTLRSDAQFMDIDGDGKSEALTYDPTFFGWKTCNAESAMPFVILKLGRHGFTLATSLMKAPPPTQARQTKLLSDWSTECRMKLDRRVPVEKYDKATFELAPQVWRDLLALIYSGNSRTAFKLLDRFWCEGKFADNLEYKEDCGVVHVSKEQFTKMFLEQLSYSPHLRELKELNRGDARICNLKAHKAHNPKICR